MKLAKQPSLFDSPTTVPTADFPKTRYQGSKRRLLDDLLGVFQGISGRTAIDLYAGTATVSVLLQRMGWSVTANDFLLYNNATARALLSGNAKKLDLEKATKELQWLLDEAPLDRQPIVADTFEGIFFPRDENIQIDRFCQNLGMIDENLRDVYIYAVGQSLLMKRPYNLFHRANLEMRTREVKRSFGNAATWNAPTIKHARKILNHLIDFSKVTPENPFSVTNCNTIDLSSLTDSVDLIYLDPPYLNSAGKGVDYCQFYHFLDGLCDYSLYANANQDYVYKPISLQPSAWMTKEGALEEIQRIGKKWNQSTIVMSYRTDGQPTESEITEAFAQVGMRLHSLASQDFKYALSHSSNTQEIILVYSQ
ncbi:MAG: DNA adenine methylase [Erythrobacter sp.]